MGAEATIDARPPIRRSVLPSPVPGFVGVPGGEFEMGDHHDLGGREHRSDEIVPPMDSEGNYILKPGKAYGPTRPVWSYKAKNPKDFYSSEISGAHRLPNGNTLICAAVHGTFFEVTPQGETVWEYVNPMVRNGILGQDQRPGTDRRGHYWNAVFKIHRYPPDYPGLKGRDLTPKGVIELPASQRGKTGLDGWSQPRRDPRRPGLRERGGRR